MRLSKHVNASRRDVLSATRLSERTRMLTGQGAHAPCAAMTFQLASSPGETTIQRRNAMLKLVDEVNL